MILLTGGSGLLGRHLFPLLKDCIAPTHEEFDILKSPLPENIHLIVHCAAYTDVNKAFEEWEQCLDLNFRATRRLAEFKVPMIYISTDSVFDGKTGYYSERDMPNPVNYYSSTKFTGEWVSSVCGHKDNKIIRTSFKERPWQHEYAFIDQYTSSDYVDVIALMIAKAINLFPNLPPILHIGTERKSAYELAKQTKPDVKHMLLDDIDVVKRPRDTSFDLTLWNSINV